MKKLGCLFLIMSMLFFCGCSFSKSEKNFEGNDGRIEYIFNDGFVTIVRDTETGVEYISRANAGTCVVVNPDGTPYIDKEAKP